MKAQSLILIVIVSIVVGNVQGVIYEISDGDDIDEFNLINDDTLTMTGGEVFGLSCFNTSNVNISGGGINELDTYDFSTVNISGGEINYLDAYDFSTVNVSGGDITYLRVSGSSTVNLSGGKILNALGAYDETAYIHLYVLKPVYYAPDGGDYFDGLIYGLWPDGSVFSLTLINWNISTFNQISFHIIPEPTSIIFLGLGAIIFKRFTAYF